MPKVKSIFKISAKAPTRLVYIYGRPASHMAIKPSQALGDCWLQRHHGVEEPLFQGSIFILSTSLFGHRFFSLWISLGVLHFSFNWKSN